MTCLTGAVMITMAGDHEGDICHLLANRPVNVHLLVRSARPRTLAAGELLPDYCAALPEQARETIDVPATGKQPARKAMATMRGDRRSRRTFPDVPRVRISGCDGLRAIL